jgi:hypothetical protein
MESWVHRCPWCDWSRNASSPTMIEPHCVDCGGLLEALPTAVRDAAEESAFGQHVPELSPAFGRVLRLALFSLLLFAAARFGWGAGGGALALAAIGVVGLFTVPLIVEE